jgi:hypothetical protein
MLLARVGCLGTQGSAFHQLLEYKHIDEVIGRCLSMMISVEFAHLL